MSDTTKPSEEPLKEPPIPEEPIPPIPPSDATWGAIEHLIHPDRAWARSAVTTQQMADASNAVLLQDQIATMAEVRRKERANVVEGKDGLLEYEDTEAEPVGDIHFGNKIDVHQERKAADPPAIPAQQPAKSNGTLSKLLIGGAIALGTAGAGGLGVYALTNLLTPVATPDVKPDPQPAPEPPKPARVYLE